jgi:hypothetical protein
VVLPLPPTVRLVLLPVIVPETVRVPASELRRAAEPRLMAPAQELAPLILRRAPVLEIPVPLSVRASVPTLMPPCNWSAAPLVTEVPEAGSLLAVPPSALEFWRLSTPAETVVVPV